MKSSYGKGGREGEKKRTCCFALSVPLLQIDLIGEKGACKTCIFIPGGDERSGMRGGASCRGTAAVLLVASGGPSAQSTVRVAAYFGQSVHPIYPPPSLHASALPSPGASAPLSRATARARSVPPPPPASAPPGPTVGAKEGRK